jgi:hypothetical protein
LLEAFYDTMGDVNTGFKNAIALAKNGADGNQSQLDLMIREHELYHGAALHKLISVGEFPIEIKPFAQSKGNSSYVINGRVGVYIKHSTLRMSLLGVYISASSPRGTFANGRNL